MTKLQNVPIWLVSFENSLSLLCHPLFLFVLRMTYPHRAAAVSAAVAARHAMRSKPAKAEPEPPAPCTRLVFHPKGSTPVQPLKEVLERRFAPDDLLSDAVFTATTLHRAWSLLRCFCICTYYIYIHSPEVMMPILNLSLFLSLKLTSLLISHNLFRVHFFFRPRCIS